MKKINFFIPNFRPGGAEKVCITLMNQLSLKHSITVYVNEDIGSLRSEVKTRVNIRTLRYKKAFANILEIRRILKRDTDNFNVVFLTHQILAVLMAAIGLSVKRIVISERNDLKRDLTGLPVLKRILFSKLIWLFYRRADKVICVSSGVKASVAELSGYQDNLITVYNPVLGHLTEKLSKKKLLNHVEKIVRGKKVLLNVGRLEIQKNHKLLISAFAKFRREFDDAVLLIAGEGSQREELEKQIFEEGLGKSVFLLGHIENPFPLYARADCFVLSSDFEGLPGVLIQALAYCKHVIATDCESGPREILKNGELGQLVNTQNEHGLSRAMFNVFNHEIDYVHFIDRDLGRFDIAENVKKYEEIIVQ